MNRPFWKICITHMFIEIFYLTQVALIPVYVREFQLTLLQASLVATVPGILQLIMNIPLSFLVDRFSTKHFLVICMFMEGLSALALSQTNNFWILVAGVSIMRVSSPIYHISGLSQISRIVKPDTMSRSIGYHNTLGSLGAAIGALSLSIFLATVGWRWLYFSWAFPILAWGLLILRSTQLGSMTVRKPVERKVSAPRLGTIVSSGFLAFLAVIALREVGIISMLTYMTTYLVTLKGLSAATASLIFAAGPFMGTLASLAGGYIGGAFGSKKALGFTLLGCAVTLSLMVVSSEAYLLALIYILYTGASYMAYVPMSTMVAEITPPEKKGQGFSAYFFTEIFVTAFTPTPAAVFISLTGIGYIIPFSVLFLTASFVLLQFIYRPKVTARPL